VIASCSQALQALADAKVVLFDGTHNVAEMRLVLTTGLIVINDVAVPGFYILTNSKTQAAYTTAFEIIKERCNNNLHLER
jgi:hypothetical protein